jgi:large-conductance mechanosensitive channel|tara:strand:+ start:324 stop:623 length:300 start_codon:yes stop_codon:yes gene_type:complete
MKIFDNFIKYFSNQNLVLTVLVTVISNYVYELVTSLINYIILPFIYKEKDNMTNDNQNSNPNDYVMKINGVTLKTGNFLRSLIKFVLLMIIIFVFTSIF